MRKKVYHYQKSATVLANPETEEWLKYRTVTNVEKLIAFLDLKHPKWAYLNLYQKSSKQFIKRINNPEYLRNIQNEYRYSTVILADRKANKWLKYRRVRYLDKLEQYLNTHYPLWEYINVYDRLNREYIRRIYRKESTGCGAGL